MNEENNNSTTAAALTLPPFVENEKVYCHDGNNKTNYYEAIIRKTKFENGVWSFMVHYSGWNNRWDRWMEAEHIWKDTSENRAKIQAQQEQENNTTATEAATSNTASTSKRSRTSESDGVRRKRLAVRNSHNTSGAASTVDQQQQFVYQDYCELPFTLKTVLVEEYERITASKHRLVHALPAPVPVSKVLNHFAKRKSKDCIKHPESGLTPELVQSFVQGLTQLFDEALSTCLLYPQERPQYEALVSSNKATTAATPPPLVDCYGCEFLLRLFVRLPMLLQQMNNSKWSPTTIGPLLTDLLVLMQKNRQTLFPFALSGDNANYRAPEAHELLAWEAGSSNKAVVSCTTDDQQQQLPTASPQTMEMDTR